MWWDESLRLGQRFDTEIDDHLSTSAGAVVVWSRQSVDRGYVRAEAQAAWSTGKLAAVMIENCKPRVPFNVEQYADLTDW